MTINRRGAQGSKNVPAPKDTPVDYNKQPPVFSFIHTSDDFCITKCSPEQLAGMADRFRMLSKMTWGEIMIAGRKNLGFEPLPSWKIDHTAPSTVKQDVQIIATRFHDNKRLVGYRENAIFHIIWCDYNGSLYDHGH